MTTRIDTYEVSLTHPDLSDAFIARVIATDPELAMSHVLGTAFHAYRHAPLLQAELAITTWWDGVWPDGSKYGDHPADLAENGGIRHRPHWCGCNRCAGMRAAGLTVHAPRRPVDHD